MENLLGALTNIPHCVKSVQIRSISLYSVRMRENTEYLSVFTPNAGKYGPEKTPYLDTFRAVLTNNGKKRMIFDKDRKIPQYLSPLP